jgi:protein-S-isoprenylcysteine O-methyltransferase Ste14
MTTREVAVGLVVLFFVLVLGVRPALHRLRSGEWGVRGLSGRPGSAAWWGGVSFVVAMLCAPVALWCDGHASPVSGAGGVLATAGLGWTVVAQAQMRASWRVGVRPLERTALVTGGLFGVVRNPVFSGMCAFALGLSLLWPNVVSLLGVAFLVVGVELQVRLVEEPALRALHGEAWTTWARRVGRFLPRLRRVRPLSTLSPLPQGEGDSE